MLCNVSCIHLKRLQKIVQLVTLLGLLTLIGFLGIQLEARIINMKHFSLNPLILGAMFKVLLFCPLHKRYMNKLRLE